MTSTGQADEIHDGIRVSTRPARPTVPERRVEARQSDRRCRPAERRHERARIGSAVSQNPRVPNAHPITRVPEPREAASPNTGTAVHEGGCSERRSVTVPVTGS